MGKWMNHENVVTWLGLASTVARLIESMPHVVSLKHQSEIMKSHWYNGIVHFTEQKEIPDEKCGIYEKVILHLHAN